MAYSMMPYFVFVIHIFKPYEFECHSKHYNVTFHLLTVSVYRVSFDIKRGIAS